MNKNLTAIILLLTSALCSKAQDSTHAALLEKLYNPRNNFYNYSAPSINSYFNEKSEVMQKTELLLTLIIS
jgi:hypothetical protein